MREIIEQVIGGIRDLITGILARLGKVEARAEDAFANLVYHWTVIEEIVARAEQEAAAWRSGIAAGLGELEQRLTASFVGALAGIRATVDAVAGSVSEMLTVEIPRIWANAQEIVQHAEEEAAAWRSGIKDLTAKVDGIWDKLEGWLVDRIVDILLKGLDKEAEKKL